MLPCLCMGFEHHRILIAVCVLKPTPSNAKGQLYLHVGGLGLWHLGFWMFISWPEVPGCSCPESLAFYIHTAVSSVLGFGVSDDSFLCHLYLYVHPDQQFFLPGSFCLNPVVNLLNSAHARGFIGKSHQVREPEEQPPAYRLLWSRIWISVCALILSSQGTWWISTHFVGGEGIGTCI